jgi:hypothetical protein
MKLFKVLEFQFMIGGLPSIDVEEMMRKFRFKDDFPNSDLYQHVSTCLIPEIHHS